MLPKCGQTSRTGRLLCDRDFYPGATKPPPGVTVRSQHLSADQLDFDEYDVASQGLISHHYRRIDGDMKGISIPFRYVWPSELDLMAELAGMKLSERWEWWNKKPFTNDSGSHVSVWEKL